MPDGPKSGTARRLALGFLALAALLASGCAHLTSDADPRDPIEPVNRGFFWFNEQFDHYLFEPAAKGWHRAVPDPVERSVTRFFDNLDYPVVAVNELLQWKPKRFDEALCRILVNTTVGCAGFFDVATGWGLPRRQEDFGQTLGRWGFKHGFYFVIPVLGPSSLRDTVGKIGDWPIRSWYTWVWPEYWYIYLSARVGEAVNIRASVLKEVGDLRASTVDFYAAVRAAYFQRREDQLYDGHPAGTMGDASIYGDAALYDESLYEGEDVEEAP